MADRIPAALRTADISRFAMRALQVEKVKPEVAYWCEYWIINRILAKGLNQTDVECANYAMALMDKLEKKKADDPDNDAIKDEVVARAYIEQFALEVFQRADNAIRANKATKQTADTFLAAATFLEVLQIWGPLDHEIGSKVKFAKYHALRIIRAIKAGEDPNLSNPPAETQDETIGDAFEEPQAENDKNIPTISQAAHQPTVEDAPDEGDDGHIPSAPRSEETGGMEAYYTHQQDIIRPSTNSLTKAPTDDGPQIPSLIPDSDTPNLPSAPVGFESPAAPPTPPFKQFDASVPWPGSTDAHDASFVPPTRPPHMETLKSPPSNNLPPQAAPVAISPTFVTPEKTWSEPPPNQVVDDASMANAQKHARWAISALNFEDVNTAIKELRIALQSLGAK